MIAGALVRCSTEKQDPASQKAAIVEWAAGKGLELAWYEEPAGTSGGLPLAERLETVRLLRDARASTIGAIVVTEVSRLNRREAVENFATISELWLAGVPLYVLDHDRDEPVDLGDLGAFLRIAFECGFAGEERKKDSARTKRAMNGGRNAAGKRVTVYGKKIGQPGLAWSAAADAWLLARRAEGQSIAAIAAQPIPGLSKLRGVGDDGRPVLKTGERAVRFEAVPVERVPVSTVHRRLRALEQRVPSTPQA
jgi:DNA invertase Pin-like site-specific DNA recombinase